MTWQLQTPLDAIIFDCDGTLSTIEGIDELAIKNGVEHQVKALTEEAMGKTGINHIMYKNRLDLVKPTREQVIALGMTYYTHRAPDLEGVLAVLQRLNKTLYIVSAGLTPAVTIFGKLLKIPEANIFAVGIEFDDRGHFLDFSHQSPLVMREGKRLLITQVKTSNSEVGFIGDGLNDYVAADLVTRFVGYGGSYYRENIAALCQYYIKKSSMAPLLPLLLTKQEQQELLPEETALYQKGLRAIQEKEVLVPR